MNCCKGKESTNGEINLDSNGLLCFCFLHSKPDLLEAIKSGTEQNILEDIKKKMKDPGCFCETANPSGKCCLPDILAFINKVKSD